MVPRVGIEPTTQGSSGLRSTTELPRHVKTDLFGLFFALIAAADSPYVCIRLVGPHSSDKNYLQIKQSFSYIPFRISDFVLRIFSGGRAWTRTRDLSLIRTAL